MNRDAHFAAHKPAVCFYLSSEVSDEPSEAEDAEPEEEQDAEEPAEQDNSPEHLVRLAEVLKTLGDFDESDLDNPKLRALAENGLALLEQQQAEAADSPEAVDARYRAQYEQLEKVVQDPAVFDPRIIEDFAGALRRCETHQDTLRVLGAAAINLMETWIPRALERHLGPAVESNYPGMSSMHNEALLSNTWDEILQSDPNFRALPQWGTPEFEALGEEIYSKPENAWLRTARFSDANGKPLNAIENLKMTARVVAKMAIGEQMSPKVLEQAYKAGREQERAAHRKLASSRAMGAGRSKGGFSESEADDPIQASFEAYKKGGGAFGR